MLTETLACMRENDPVWWLPYPNTPAGGTHTQSCPQNGSSAVVGMKFIRSQLHLYVTNDYG